MMINDCFSYDLSTGVFTDGEYEVTNTIREIHHIFWPRTTDMTITFTAWGKNEPAAAFGFSIYELDELKCNDIEKSDYINTRKFGVQYEDPCGAVSDLGAQTFDEWGDKFIEYAKHTGQNVIVQPINWYSGPMFDSKTQPAALWYWLTLSNRQQYTVTSSKPDDWISPFLDKCEAANIDFIGGMTLLRLGNLLENKNVDLDAIIDGKDTYNNMRFDNKVQASTNDWTLIYNALNLEKMIKEGRKVRSNENFEYVYGEKTDDFGAAPMFNPLHPEVQRQLIEYFEEISEKYGNKKAFKGVSINIWHATLVWYSSLSVGYDDYTINLFAKETGIKIPCEEKDPERFRNPSVYRQLITYTVNDKGICTAINFPKKVDTDFERFDSTEQELIRKGEFRLSAVEPQERFRPYNNSFGGKIALLPNAKVFLIPDQSTGDAKLEKFEVITLSQIIHDKEYKNIRSYDANEAGLANICVVEADLTGEGRLISRSAVNVVSGNGLILNENKETRKSIILFFGEEEIGIPVTDECAQNSGKNINTGDIIQYVMNSNGEITYIKKYYDSTKGYEQKFASNSVYTAASFVAGRCITRDVENDMLVFDYGDTTPLILSYETLPSIFVYNTSRESLRKGSVADMRPDSYAFVRMDYFRIQDIIIFE